MVRAVHQARNAGDVDIVPHVSAVGYAPDCWRIAGDGSMGGAHLGNQLVRGGDFGRSELAAEPLDPRRMLREPGIVFGSLHDRGYELGFEAIECFTWDEPSAALGDQPVGYRRRPGARSDHSDIDGYLVGDLGIEGMIEGAVPFG